ncbi:hypothetical protein 1013_scaffold1563_00060 [Bacteriophage sp.]|nr:hypothetical protein 1013_scaffold1563_00060 [Bacteriophage sp.]
MSSAFIIVIKLRSYLFFVIFLLFCFQVSPRLIQENE